MTFKSALAATLLGASLTAGVVVSPVFALADHHAQSSVTVDFMTTDDHEFSAEERAAIEAVLARTHAGVREHFPELTAQVSVQVGAMSRDLEAVGGVTGRADAPGEIVIFMSTVYPGGIMAAIEAGLASTFSHELHHLARGWTINENQFGPGIHIAMVNEGLANVFAEEFTGLRQAGNQPPETRVAESWASEIMELPVNANYGEWMFRHSDGRMGIGYRTGTYIIRKVMDETGMTIEDISELSPEEIHALAGLVD